MSDSKRMQDGTPPVVESDVLTIPVPNDFSKEDGNLKGANASVALVKEEEAAEGDDDSVVIIKEEKAATPKKLLVPMFMCVDSIGQTPINKQKVLHTSPSIGYPACSKKRLTLQNETGNYAVAVIFCYFDPIMAPSLSKVLKYYCLLDAELRSQGRPLTISERRFLEYAIAYNHHRRLSSYCKRQALLALRARNTRRWHVRPIFRNREIYGAWYSLIPTMRESDPEEYFRFLRMTPDCFDWLLSKVEPFIKKKSNRQSISPGERLAITLRYLASADSQQSLSYLFRLSNQVISKIVTETTAVIWYTLKPVVFEEITEDFWRRKASEFESMWQFPISFPSVDPSFFNYKGANSIILFAVADATYKFIVADCGARGRESDGGVFERSQFGKLFKEDKLLALHNLHLMREDSIPPKQRLYLPAGFADTYKSNGVLKAGRWRNKEVSMEKSIFQNLALQEVHCAAPHTNGRPPKMVRDDFIELFIAEPLPWQWDLLL
ncbi:Protein ALP1-like [Frankliniella fusca]|uniref:Protein ALP1-like n=1 Tax=Frankliniella fusca TaxID=407009 RepID=A0AAE1HJ66_9NEOP|nr:Protein ALP1-like [Frankliniella fusca]